MMSGGKVTCEICKEATHKYKCPRCLLKYCSVSCYKTHKENGCAPVNKKEHKQERNTSEVNFTISDMPTDDSSDTEDKVPASMLAKLGESEELVDLLRNPALRNVILEIDNAKAPEVAIAKAMQEPVFIEFADKCLAVVEPENNNTAEPWDCNITDSD